MLPIQESTIERRPRRILGFRIAALIETGTLLAAALAVDELLLGGNRFAGVTPHPFWAVVLLAAAQYGTREGILAAALAAAALMVGRLPEQGFGEDLNAWLLRIGETPVLWFAAGVVFGEIRDGHRREADALRENLTELREQASAIAEAYERLSATKAELETRVAGQVRTVHAMYAAARAIEQQGTGEVLIGVAPLVRSVLSPAKFSLFLLNGQLLEAAATEGWHSDDQFLRVFDPASPLFLAVIGRRQILTGANAEYEAILRGEGMLAGPLVSEETGKVVGMLKIEEIPFIELTLSSVQSFRILCDWIGTAYDNALRYERLLAEQVLAASPRPNGE
jgi:polysaccharide biosynthesis protein PelD